MNFNDPQVRFVIFGIIVIVLMALLAFYINSQVSEYKILLQENPCELCVPSWM